MARQTDPPSASSPADNALSPSPCPAEQAGPILRRLRRILYHDSQDTGREHMRPPYGRPLSRSAPGLLGEPLCAQERAVIGREQRLFGHETATVGCPQRDAALWREVR